MAIMALCCAGCGANKVEDPYVGNMGDFSYGGQITREQATTRYNAEGEEVTISDFAGKFVWADYAAPWCQPCVPQANVIATLERNLKDHDVAFLTVITSGPNGYGDIPTIATAKQWAGRHGLNPHRVVAADNLSSWSVPTHILYSPEGQSLYRSTGQLSEEQIRTVLFGRMSDYHDWTEHGARAGWMKSGSE